MRPIARKLATLSFLLVVVFSMPCSAQDVILAGGQSLDETLADARRTLEIAKIELRLYVQVEYPRQRRHLDAQVKFISAEIDALKERVREYKDFHRSRYSRAFLTSLQETKLALLDAELRLRETREERSALRRFHSDQWRLRELKVEAARAQVIALDRLRNGP